MKLIALLLLCAPVLAGQKTVTGSFVSTAQRAVRDANGVESYPSWELRIPRWDPAGCYRADGTPASVADLYRVDLFVTENVHTWTWATNESSQERGWWMLAGGTRSFLSRANLEGVPEPASSGFVTWEGATVEYLAGAATLAPSATQSGYYWGPVPPSFTAWIGPGDRAAINMWARPTPGLGNDLRRYVSLRAKQEWLADFAGHASWTTRVEASFAPTVTVVYRYRDVPDTRHLRAIVGPWIRSPLSLDNTSVTETVPGLPYPYLPSDVGRVVLQHKYDFAVHYGIENQGLAPANCGGLIYWSTDLAIGGQHITGLGTSIGMGAAGPSNTLTAFDGTTDWGGTSGLYITSNRFSNIGGDDAANMDTDVQNWFEPGYVYPFVRSMLTAPTLDVSHGLNPASGFYPASATSGVPSSAFGWDGRLRVTAQTRLVWFVQ